VSDIANIFGQREFIIRRIHSLLGLLPVGVFFIIHLATNASILDGPVTYQQRVDQIHNLGPITLLFVEWIFILLPILFHGFIGLIIVARGKRNVFVYPYRENFRYTLQRLTSVVVFMFIIWHVFQTRDWLQVEWWTVHVTKPLGGGKFNVLDAAATAAKSIRASSIIQIAYALGILASVYHFANGLWTIGITWGLWTTPNSQRWANYLCAALGLVFSVVGMAALVGMVAVRI
jgi:succinate dehydrogenase / fumarate reductase, cytochrome b subunit